MSTLNVTGKALIAVFSRLIGILKIVKILPVVIEKIVGAFVVLCFWAVFIMGLHVWGLQDDLQALGHKSPEFLLPIVSGRLGAIFICSYASFTFIWSIFYIVRNLRNH